MIKNGATFTCTVCGRQFYRSRSDIARGRTKTCGKPECKQGPRFYRRKGATFTCVVCGAQFYRSQSDIKRGLTKTCGKAECRATYMRRPRPGPRPYRKTGTMLKCVVCGEEFYRKRNLIERGVNKTCGKSECKSQFFSGTNNPAWGRMPSEQNRRAVSDSNKRRTGPPKGFKHTMEARAKIREASKRMWQVNRDKMIAALTKPPKPRELMRYRKDFTPWQRKEWKGPSCVWCDSSDHLVLDHIIPIVAGGLNIKGNAQTLCQTCNLWMMVYMDRPYYLASLAAKARKPDKQSPDEASHSKGKR